MKAFIVDDNTDSRRIIALLLKERFPMISIVGEANNVEDAVSFLSSNQIDLLFLDIQLRNGTGFDILESLESINFDVIFVTAHERFAIKAIRYNALDYILKPIDQEEFNIAVQRSLSKKNISTSNKIDSLLQTIDRAFKPKRLNLPTQHGFKIIALNEITRCESDSNYTNFYLENGSSILVSKTMKKFEPILLDNSFVRIHNSHIINIHSIQEYIKGRGGEVILSNGKRLAVSNGRKEALLRKLKLRS